MRHERWLPISILLPGLSAGLLVQVAPVNRDGGRRVRTAHTIEASLAVSEEARGILERACRDCHSNQTRRPWYARVAPVSWMVTEEVERGRRAMNLSQWSAQAGAERGALRASCESVETGRMPPAGYRMLHPEARIGAGEAAAFCEWAEMEARGIGSRQARETERDSQ